VRCPHGIDGGSVDSGQHLGSLRPLVLSRHMARSPNLALSLDLGPLMQMVL